ncbi:MAG: transposase [Thermodesulfobium sp.]
MSYIRYKTLGNKVYAYEVSSYWDKEKKMSRQKSKYLGLVVDKEKGEFVKSSKVVKLEEKELIVDFGDSYAIHEFIKTSDVLSSIQYSHPKLVDEIILLCIYKLSYPSAMTYLKSWYVGNYVSRLFPGIAVESQRISEYLKKIGNENNLRKFFTKYLQLSYQAKDTLLIDTTALPNQVHMPITSWGKVENQIEKTIRFLFVVDKRTGKPLYFRYLPGQIPDVSVLSNTIRELCHYDVSEPIAILDAGFVSTANLSELKSHNIKFLTRLRSGTRIYNDLLKKHVKDIEAVKNAYKYEKRVVYIKKSEIEMAGISLYAYVVLDPITKAEKSTKFLANVLDDSVMTNVDLEFELMKKGVFVLISSIDIEPAELLYLYYERQKVEQLFGFLKDDLDILPLRVHGEETLKGYLFISFISLAVYVEMREKLKGKYSFEDSLIHLRNLKCKIYGSDEIIGERTKQQREVFEYLGIRLPQ